MVKEDAEHVSIAHKGGVLSPPNECWKWERLFFILDFSCCDEERRERKKTGERKRKIFIKEENARDSIKMIMRLAFVNQRNPFR